MQCNSNSGPRAGGWRADGRRPCMHHDDDRQQQHCARGTLTEVDCKRDDHAQHLQWKHKMQPTVVSVVLQVRCTAKMQQVANCASLGVAHSLPRTAASGRTCGTAHRVATARPPAIHNVSSISTLEARFSPSRPEVITQQYERAPRGKRDCISVSVLAEVAHRRERGDCGADTKAARVRHTAFIRATAHRDALVGN